ncbi:MAG: DUF1932 domain-containing protein [Trueperaceae bacterium]|nr:DUF1932 domain-containing protein [Trueperaceae bacterium]
MSTRLTVGVLHPGAMGAAVASTLSRGGHDVVWASAGRSAASRRRADEAGARDVGELATLVRVSDAIVSVCPPGAAPDLARAVSEAGFDGTYLDANAVSPMRAKEIAALTESTGARFVDGGIVGGPPSERGTTWLHLAGPDATEVAAWFAAGPLETNVVGDRIGDASALKACFAAWTKGRTALQTTILAAAQAYGVREPLRDQWERYEPGFLAGSEARARRVTAKAWRFEAEMHEIAAAFEAVGLPGGFHRAAADVYGRLAPLRPDEADGVSDEPDLAAVLRALLDGRTSD